MHGTHMPLQRTAQLPILPATKISYIWDTQNSFLHVEISIQVAVHLPTNDLVCASTPRFGLTHLH